MRKVSVEAVDTVRRRLAVEIPASEVVSEVELAYAELKKHAEVKGFRRGKVPRSVLERLFGDQVRGDVFARLIQSSYEEALREQRIEPLSEPEIVTEQAEVGAALRYSATVEVKPEIHIEGYEGIEVERPLHEVTEADVDRYLDRVRYEFAQLLPVTDRDTVEVGDIVTADYEVREGTKSLGRFTDRQLEVPHSNEPFSWIARLAGRKVGDHGEFEVEYPGDFPDPNLAGKRISFSAVVKAIAIRELPALDDEFAKDYGDCDTLAEWRANVREALRKEAELEADKIVRGALLEKLLVRNDFEVPRSVVKRRAAMLADNFLDRLGPRRPPESKIHEFRHRLEHEFEGRARDLVKADLIVDAIARQEGITVSEAEINSFQAAYERHLKSSGREASARDMVENPELRSAVRWQILREHVLDFLVAKARITTIRAETSVADAERTR